MSALLAAAALSCTTPSESPPPPPATQKPLTAEEFKALLQEHVTPPVQSVGKADPYAGIQPEMEDFPDPSKMGLTSDPKPVPVTTQPASPPVAPVPALSPDDQGPPAPPQGGAAQGPEPAPAPAAAPEPQTNVAPGGVAESPPQLVGSDENPYIRFGERIKVNPDGTITKPFPLRVGTGEKLQSLIVNYGNFPIWTDKNGPGPSPANMVKVDLLSGWDLELYQDLRAPVTVAPGKVELADWLMVTAGPDLLGEVEDFINLFAAAVPQIEIEAKVVEVALTDSLSYGITPVGNQPIWDFPDGGLVKEFNYNLPNAGGLVNSVLTVGAIQNGVAFNAALEAIAGKENVSIINQPKIAVREGGRAEINATTKIPYLSISGINQSGGYTANVAYIETGVKLYVIPRVVGTQTVALNIDIEASQQTGDQVTLVDASGGQFPVPEVSTRGAKTTVYLQPGQAVILGGLISERSFEQISKVPLLGDVPILKYLFSSTSTGKRQTNVLFFIRPRILQGIDLHRAF